MWPLLELKGGQPEVWFSKEVRVQNVLRALLCICGSIDHKGGRDKRWKRNPSPIHGLRGHVCWNAPLGPLLVVPLISKRKSTFWRDWSVKKKTPCCKHSPSSISMLLRIVRKGETDCDYSSQYNFKVKWMCFTLSWHYTPSLTAF